METKIVKLKFLAPVHFGRGRLSDSAYTCDVATLFSALFIEALREGCSDELLSAARTGALSISDAFPFVGDVLYLPKPMVPSASASVQRSKLDGTQDSRARKASKKLEYIPALRYRDYLSGDFDPVVELEHFDIGTSALQTRVNLLRTDTENALPYHVGSFSFSPDAGLYFLAQTDGFELDALLESLSYSGLGGKRSSGYGRFSYSIENCDSLSVISGDSGTNATESVASKHRSVLLSTAAPTSAELTDELLSEARYKVVRRGGFVQSATYSETLQKRRDFYLFAAGSVFTRRFTGDVFDVGSAQGTHPVYRYARAMWMEV